MPDLFFPNCLILNVTFANSKAGNPYARYSFLEQTSLNVYELMAFGDGVSVLMGLQRGSVVSLGFNVLPDVRNGGVRLEIVAVGQAGIDSTLNDGDVE